MATVAMLIMLIMLVMVTTLATPSMAATVVMSPTNRPRP